MMTTAEKSTGRGKGLLVGSLKATARERGHDQRVFLVFLPSVDLNQINVAYLQLVVLLTAQSLSPLGLLFPQFLDLPYPSIPFITKKGTSLLPGAQRDKRNLTNPGLGHLPPLQGVCMLVNLKVNLLGEPLLQGESEIASPLLLLQGERETASPLSHTAERKGTVHQALEREPTKGKSFKPGLLQDAATHLKLHLVEIELKTGFVPLEMSSGKPTSLTVGQPAF